MIPSFFNTAGLLNAHLARALCVTHMEVAWNIILLWGVYQLAVATICCCFTSSYEYQQTDPAACCYSIPYYDIIFIFQLLRCAIFFYTPQYLHLKRSVVSSFSSSPTSDTRSVLWVTSAPSVKSYFGYFGLAWTSALFCHCQGMLCQVLCRWYVPDLHYCWRFVKLFDEVL